MSTFPNATAPLDANLIAALGGDILNRTFPENVPLRWYHHFRDMGFTPTPVPEATEAPEIIEARNEVEAAEQALADILREMPVEMFITARNAGWTPGEPFPILNNTENNNE